MVALAWIPSQRDLDFCRYVVSTVKDGGYWVAPSTGLTYKLNRTAKTLTLQAGDPECDTHKMTVIAFFEIGWTVKEAKDG